MQSRRNISGTLLAIILVLLHFFALLGLFMSIPFEASHGVKLGARISMACVSYGFIQAFYILLRPSFSAPCPHRTRLLKTGGFALSALISLVNLLVSSGTSGFGSSLSSESGSGSEDVVQGSAAALALFHGGLYWAYTRVPKVFLPFVVFDRRPPVILSNA